MVEKIGQEAMNDVEKLKEKIGGIFQEFDKDGSRGIDEIELRQGMKELGITLLKSFELFKYADGIPLAFNPST